MKRFKIVSTRLVLLAVAASFVMVGCGGAHVESSSRVPLGNIQKSVAPEAELILLNALRGKATPGILPGRSP